MESTSVSRGADPAEALRSAFEPGAMITALETVGVDRELLGVATGAEERTVRRWAQEPASHGPLPGTPWTASASSRCTCFSVERCHRASSGNGFGRATSSSGWIRSLECADSVDAIRDDDLPAVFAAINALIRTPASENTSTDNTDGGVEDATEDAERLKPEHEHV